MIASRRRGQGLMPGLQDQELVGPTAGEESFWSSFSVVESLFSDEQASGRGDQGNGGSRLPFMRQLKSQEAFPPLPPSSSPYEDAYGGNNNHHHHGSRRGGHHQRSRGGGGSGEWITPHTNTNGNVNTNSVGHHLFPPVGNNNGYYNAFNGYNQHFAGLPTAVNDNGYNATSNGSPQFSMFSDYHPRQSQQHGSGSISIGQNAFSAVPDLVERRVQSPYSHSPVGSPSGIELSSSPHGFSSPSAARRLRQNPTLTTTATTIIAPPSSHPIGSPVLGTKGPLLAHTNKICCDEKALLEEDSLQTKGMPFSLLLALPNEHLLKIMSCLSGRDLVNLQMVGKKRLAALSTDNGLWKALYLKRWKLLEILPETNATASMNGHGHNHNNNKKGGSSSSSSAASGEESDEWAWIHSLLQQNERWKDIFQSRHSAERWRIGTLKMFNGCWGFISQHAPDSTSSASSSAASSSSLNANNNNSSGETLDIFFHRKDIAPEGDWYEDWWLKDTPGVSRSQKCGYWDTFLCGRVVRYKQRAAYAQGRRPQACNISFVGDERRERIPSLQYGVGGTLITPDGMVLPPSMRFAPSPNGN